MQLSRAPHHPFQRTACQLYAADRITPMASIHHQDAIEEPSTCSGTRNHSRALQLLGTLPNCSNCSENGTKLGFTLGWDMVVGHKAPLLVLRISHRVPMSRANSRNKSYSLITKHSLEGRSVEPSSERSRFREIFQLSRAPHRPGHERTTLYLLRHSHSLQSTAAL